MEGAFSSHSLRKTFGYTMRVGAPKGRAPVVRWYIITPSGRQTLRYVGTTADELAAVYMLGPQ